MKLEWVGRENLEKKFLNLSKIGGAGKLPKTLVNALKPTVLAARRIAHKDTGLMARTIHARIESDNEAVLESPQLYSVYEEFGTRYHPPHPFMRPALFETQSEIERLVAGDWRAEINKEVE